jgi:hypothetical protein
MDPAKEEGVLVVTLSSVSHATVPISSLSYFLRTEKIDFILYMWGMYLCIYWLGCLCKHIFLFRTHHLVFVLACLGRSERQYQTTRKRVLIFISATKSSAWKIHALNRCK